MPRTSKKQALKGVRYVAARKIDNSTVMYYRRNGQKIFRVHATDLITVYPDGRMRFDTQGKLSYLQRRRINQLQHAIRIETRNGHWYVARAGDQSAWRKRLPAFFDGLMVDPAGNIL